MLQRCVYSPSVHTNVNLVIAALGLSLSSVQNDSSKGTSRQAGSPCGHNPASPSDDLDVGGLDVFRVDTHGDGQHLLDIVVCLGTFNFRHKGGVETVMGVHCGAGVAVEKDAEIDKVEKHVSNDFAEVYGQAVAR